MKHKINKFLSRSTTLEALLTACMSTFLVTLLLTFLWVLALTGSWSNFVNTVKFSQVLAITDRVYIGEADADSVADAGFSAMIAALGDRWSYYMTAEEFERYQQVQSNTYTGVGVTLRQTEAGYAILAVAADSPADRAGVTAGTYLVAVNGVRLTEETTSEISAMMHADPNNICIIVADATGAETEYTLAMEVIYSNPVSYEMKKNNVGYIKIENFDEHCAEEAIAAVDALMEQGAEALVFDVRGNGGGYVTELCKLLDYLLPEGELFVSVDENGKEKVTYSDKHCVDLPMAVLVDENSYSAAEFFAAALREYDAAVLVGAKTTGKNRSQTNVLLVDGGAVHISSRRYLTPNRVDLTEQGGLIPDIEVAAGEGDPQLAAALGIFNG